MRSVVDNRGYNQGWYENKATIVRANRRTHDMIAEMDINPDSKILEIGCGLGSMSYYMACETGMQVTGTDICVPFIDKARETYHLPNLNYEVLDFNNTASFEGQHYNYIIGNGILHHLYYNLDIALVNLRKLLADDGKIIFYEPNIYNPYCAVIFQIPFFRKWAKLEPAEKAFSRPFIIMKLRNAGFHDIHVKFKDFLLPGIPKALIKPSIIIGDVLEKIPLVDMVAQSLFIVAGK